MERSSPPAPVELGALIEASHIECFRHLGQASPAAPAEAGGPHVIITGVPHPLFNGVLGARLAPEGLADCITAALQPFEERGIAMWWWVGPTTAPADLGDTLAARGLQPGEAMPGMATDLSRFRAAPQPAGLAIERVGEAEGLRQWIACTNASFQVAEAVSAPLFDLLARSGLAAPWRYFLGRQAGTPVAASGLYLGSRSAYVFSVATAPEARRHGFGTAITAAALYEARAQGYALATLYASPMGRPVYQRLGFQEHGWMTLYLWSPAGGT